MSMDMAVVRMLARIAVAAGIAVLTLAGEAAFAQAKQAAAKPAAFDASACLACHAPIKAFYDAGKHKTVGCNACHDGTADASCGFVEAPDDENRPRHVRRLSPEPVQVVRADGLAPRRALREEADDRAGA